LPQAPRAQEVAAMELNIVEIVSVASGVENEDRAGAAPPLAWVIDGATDVLPEALTRDSSDAAWFAAALDRALHAIAAAPPATLAELPAIVAERISPEFLAAARRAPAARQEHPSASAVVVRALAGGGLEYVSVGDCELMAEADGRLIRIGVDAADAGDRWVADALAGRGAADAQTKEPPLTRAELWPRLFAQRARMNTESGYGVFSITPTPRRFVRHGILPLPAHARVLIATDGLTRLVDVFRRYDPERLFSVAWSDGLAALVAELRALEAADAGCTAFPRAKVSDDTTAIRLRLT
jgi:hypothetical protein